MSIYDYCATWVESNAKPGDRILDYGCGLGAIIQKVRSKGLDAYGCDVFYEGGDRSNLVESDLLTCGIIKRMTGDNIPFDDGSFDIIINNQVMEHVPDLEIVLAEIHRVLKPGGKVLSLFPDSSVWREGHVGIPFVHWFPKGSQIRVAYAFTLRCLGLGYHKHGKSRWQWRVDACAWIDKWTHYRSLKVIQASFRKHFHSIRGLETNYLKYRLEMLASPLALKFLPEFLSTLVVRKLACLVFEARKA